MATTYNYSITQNQAVLRAFRLLGLYNDDSPPPSTDVANAVMALNLMLKEWMTKNFNLWCYSTISFPTVSGQTSYTLGPAGTISVYKPLRIPDARIQLSGSGTYPLEIKLTELSRQEYDLLGVKTQPGTPNSYYYDPQLLNGILNLYLTPNATVNTVILDVQRPIADVLNSTDNFDLPIEWNNAICYGLANELMFEYDVVEGKADRISARANQALNDMLNFDQEDASIFFTPDYRGGKRG